MFSATSASRLLLVTTAIVGVRHLLFRRAQFHRRLLDQLAAVRGSEAVLRITPVFLLSRVCVILVGLMAVLVIGVLEGSEPFRESPNELLNFSARWDAGMVSPDLGR